MKKVLNKLNKFSKTKKVLLLFLIGIISLPLFFTFSRYVIEKVTEHYFNSNQFYFNSETLDESVYDLYSWDGSDDYTFGIDVNNFKDNLSWSDTSINYEYELTCTNGEIILNCSTSSTGVLLYNSNNKTINNDTITITKGLSEINSGDTITVFVRARSVEPYAKTLTATFNFHINNFGISYQILDEIGSPYLTLLITNVGEAKNISVEFDSLLLNIDDTNTNVINNTTFSNSSNVINKIELSVGEDNVYSLRFYKNNINVNYSMNNSIFTIN